MSSRGVNKVILVGNVGQAPDVRTMSNGEQVANFSLATSETWNDRHSGEKREKTEWHRCAAYRRIAEIIGQYVRKGSKLYLEGKLQTRKWRDNNGQDRYTTEIIVNEIQMLDSRTDGNGPQNPQDMQRAQKLAQYQTAGKVATPPPQTAQDFDDDEIPF